MAASKLRLNDDKTEFLTICAPWLRQRITVTNITVGLSGAAAVSAARNLGVMMDHALNMDTHIQHLCRTAMLHLSNTADIRRCLTQDAAEKVIHAFVIVGRRGSVIACATYEREIARSFSPTPQVVPFGPPRETTSGSHAQSSGHYIHMATESFQPWPQDYETPCPSD